MERQAPSQMLLLHTEPGAISKGKEHTVETARQVIPNEGGCVKSMMFKVKCQKWGQQRNHLPVPRSLS